MNSFQLMLNMNNNKESRRRGGGYKENATSYVHKKLTKTIVATDTDTAAERDTDTDRATWREIRMLIELGTCMKQEPGVRGGQGDRGYASIDRWQRVKGFTN